MVLVLLLQERRYKTQMRLWEETKRTNNAISGKNPRMANTATIPTSRSATTQPGAAGIKAVTAAAVATKAIGAAQKIGLSAPEGTIISFETNFSPSASS